MRKRTSLIARLDRLEKRQLRKPFRRKIILAVKDMADSDVVGISSGKIYVPRLASEAVHSLQRRAAGIIPSSFLFRCYSTPSSASEDESGADRATF